MKVFDKESANGANRYRYYEYDDTGIFVYTNYDEHVVEYFKQALDIAKVHGMKNFVLDESYNGGGAVTVGLFKMAPGNSYNISAFRTCATKGDLDVDSGATPDYDLTKTGDDGMIDYSDFHNFALVDSILDKHYLSNNLPSQTVNDGRSGTTLKVKNVPKTNDVFDFLGFLVE